MKQDLFSAVDRMAPRLLAMADEHRIILEAMTARDTEALRRIVPAHLASGQSAAERRLAERGDLSA